MSKRCPIWKDGKQCVLYWRGPGHAGQPHKFDRDPTELERAQAENNHLRQQLAAVEAEHKGASEAFWVVRDERDKAVAEASDLRAQLAKVRADRDTMLRVHDEMEAERDAAIRERDEARVAVRACQDELEERRDKGFELSRDLNAARAECERMRAALVDVRKRTGHCLFNSGVDLGAIRMVIDDALFPALSPATSGGKEQT